MTMEQLKLAEWLRFHVVNRTTSLRPQLWIHFDSLCSWVCVWRGGARARGLGKLCLREQVTWEHLAGLVKAEQERMA